MSMSAETRPVLLRPVVRQGVAEAATRSASSAQPSAPELPLLTLACNANAHESFHTFPAFGL